MLPQICYSLLWIPRKSHAAIVNIDYPSRLTIKLTCRRGIGELEVPETCHAPPVRCSAWFGGGARCRDQRSTAYRARSRLEPSKVRWPIRRSEPGGRVSNARTPSPTTPAPIMKCSSSTKPPASRSFQRT